MPTSDAGHFIGLLCSLATMGVFGRVILPAAESWRGFLLNEEGLFPRAKDDLCRTLHILAMLCFHNFCVALLVLAVFAPGLTSNYNPQTFNFQLLNLTFFENKLISKF